MVNLNANVSSLLPKANSESVGIIKSGTTNPKPDFANVVKGIEKYVSKVDELQLTQRRQG